MTPQRVTSFVTYPDNHHHLEQTRIPAYLKGVPQEVQSANSLVPVQVDWSEWRPTEDFFVRKQAQKENLATRIGVGWGGRGIRRKSPFWGPTSFSCTHSLTLFPLSLRVRVLREDARKAKLFPLGECHPLVIPDNCLPVTPTPFRRHMAAGVSSIGE